MEKFLNNCNDFLKCKDTIMNTQLKWFQLRLLHHTIPTKYVYSNVTYAILHKVSYVLMSMIECDTYSGPISPMTIYSSLPSQSTADSQNY